MSRRIPIADAVNAFYGTFLGLRDEKRREAERAEESRWKGVLERMQLAQDARAQESHERAGEVHGQNLEQGQYVLEQMRRESEAAASVLEREGKTLEQLRMENDIAGLGQYAEDMRNLALEQARLNNQQAQYMLETYYPAQLGAMTGGGGGYGGGGGVGGGGDGGDVPEGLSAADLQDQWELYDKRRKSLWSAIESRYKDPRTGDVDLNLAAQSDPGLWQSLQETEAHWGMLNDQINALGGGAMGLPMFDRTGSSEVQPEAPADPWVGLRPKSTTEPVDKEGNPVQTPLERFMGQALAPVGQPKAEGVVWVDPSDGNLVPIDDPVQGAYLKKQGATLLHPSDVPTRWYGKPYEDFKEDQRLQRNRPSAFSSPAGAAAFYRR